MRRRLTSPVVPWAALAVSLLALVMSSTGISLAGTGAQHRSSRHPRGAGQIVRTGPGGKIPANLLPVVREARNASKLGGNSASQVVSGCPSGTVDIGTWCLDQAPYSLSASQAGLNNYFFATRACEGEGGYLPTAAQLIGAANKVPLESVINDSPTKATIDQDPTNGLSDQREMSATLVTTAAGSDAAGSEGVSVGSTGNPKLDQPNPTPEPAVPEPETLQYVTVYDNFQKGGFAGSEPVSAPENFRCAFDKVSAASMGTSGSKSASARR